MGRLICFNYTPRHPVCDTVHFAVTSVTNIRPCAHTDAHISVCAVTANIRESMSDIAPMLCVHRGGSLAIQPHVAPLTERASDAVAATHVALCRPAERAPVFIQRCCGFLKIRKTYLGLHSPTHAAAPTKPSNGKVVSV
jgi:hypothetical protein